MLHQQHYLQLDTLDITQLFSVCNDKLVLFLADEILYGSECVVNKH